MQVFHSSREFEQRARKRSRGAVVALGNFDGVHRAHVKLLAMGRRLAKKLGAPSAVYTFHPHPVQVLSKASSPLMITTLEQKLELLAARDLDFVVVEPFTRAFSGLAPEAWFSRILVDRLQVRGVVAGYDFTFGSHRSGTTKTLQQLCQQHGIACAILEAQLLSESLVSSTQIRRFVGRGEVEQAAKLLGHPFFLDGKVAHGHGRGRKLGFATANLQTENELLPPTGVYACYAEVEGRRYRAVVNVGYNPTFGGGSLSIEAHLLRFRRMIYGKGLRLFFLKRIRGERKFEALEGLVGQIREDIEVARQFF